LARSNYQFNKRQKELARKRKKEEKKQKKLEKGAIDSDNAIFQPQDDKEAP
jgi:hypothetical protein